MVDGGEEHLVDELVLLLRRRQEEERVLQSLCSGADVLLALSEDVVLKIRGEFTGI